MAIHRTRAWLLAWALQMALAGWAMADQPHAEPASGDYFPMTDDAQIFSPADLSEYGGGPPRRNGWFFSWDWMRWGISVPDKSDIGNPFVRNVINDGVTTGFQRNTYNTSILGTGWENGYRWEGGFINDDRGWLFSAFQLYANNQRFRLNNAGMNFQDHIDPTTGIGFLQGFVDLNNDGFDDNLNGFNFQGNYLLDPPVVVPFPIYGRDGADTDVPPDGEPDTPAPTDYGDLAHLAVSFDQILVVNHTELWGTELSRVWRFPPGKYDGCWDFFAGIRYLKFDERFHVSAVGGSLANGFWNTRGNNNLVGPQIGLRGKWQRGRFGFSTEGRFFAAVNNQQLSQRGELASTSNPGGDSNPNGPPTNMPPIAWNIGSRQTEWAPLGEFRLEGTYQVFSAVSLKLGWTGMIMNGIARPSQMVWYNLPDMGLIEDQNRSEVWAHGINLGIEVNR